MKMLVAAAAALFFVTPALAQTAPAAPTVVAPSRCPTPTEAPTAPDAARATATEIDAGVAAFNAWVEQTEATLDCLRDEYAELNAQAEARLTTHNETRAGAVAAQAAWQEQVALFNARSSRRRR